MAYTMTPWGYDVDGTLPPLIDVETFNELTGGRYADDERLDSAIDAASAAIRAYCGWHVAPVLDCSITLDGEAGDIWLPTNALASVTSAKVGGEIKSGAVHSAGSLKVEKGIEAEEFRAAGAIDCGGLLNAETVDISMDGRAHSRVGSIGGGEIRVYLRKSEKPKKRRLPLFSRLVNGGSDLTVSELVEGDVVALECVKVPTVVGRVVAIGAGCEIDLVQYSEECEVDPDAQVGRCEKI